MRKNITSLDALADISSLETGYDVFRFLKQASNDAGFESFTLFGMPSEQETLREATMLGTWQPQLVAAYDELCLAGESAVLSRARSSTLPFTWQIEAINAGLPDDKRQRAIDLFTDFNMTQGLVCPIHVPDQTAYLIEFTGSSIPKEPDLLNTMHILALHATERLRALTKPDPCQTIKLTQRERDCLYWTAEGKTSAEIATILSISEHTVNHYLSLAARKLNSHTRAQAIARAIRLGLIS
ncbi:MAG: LuxR C-terminal-related transcriptional regulator [Pseudomonadota bacterium]